MTSQPRRRSFLKSATASVAAATAAGGTGAALSPRTSQAAEGSVAEGSTAPVVLGVIGVGGMGANHVRNLAGRKDVRIAYVCDVDQNRLAAARKEVQQRSGKTPQAVSDLRRVLQDKSVEAVFIATPDHWHTPAAILALAAGKHVYVEKPCCHNILEGKLLTAAAKRSGKVVQVGTQSRSTEIVSEAIQRVREGEIGDVLVAKAWNSQRRGSIGKSQPSKPPAHLNFDLWLGPAPETEYRSNMLPGIWRWWRDFGCGDIGNDGVHDIDVAVWGLGVETHPVSAACLGGKYYFDDDQQFPDTQYAVFEYPHGGGPPGGKKQLIFEQRIWTPYTQQGYENGAAFYGEKGQLIIGHTVGWRLYGPRNKLIAERKGRADLVAHHTNFLDCVRGRTKSVNADARTGQLSATLVHLANIAARVGRVLTFDPNSHKIEGDAEGNALVARSYRPGHWATPQDAA